MSKITPHPGVVRPRKRGWTITEAPMGGSVRLSTGELNVPLDDTDDAYGVRRHEMGHVAFSRSRYPRGRYSARMLQYAEDRNIEIKLQKAGVPPAPQLAGNRLKMLEIQVELGMIDPPTAAGMIYAALGTPDEETVRTVLWPIVTESYGEDYAQEAYSQADWILGTSYLRKHGRVVQTAEFLTVAFEEGSLVTVPGAPDLVAEETSHTRWGALHFVDTDKPLILPSRMRSRRPLGAEEGTLPRYVQRYCTDGRVFARRQKRPRGGTVLIDCSGSMSLTDEQILSILGAMPAATIATYCGLHTVGELRVVARNGRRAREGQLTCGWGGNVVDGPALKWLGRQAEPRVWVSDGAITGRNDDPIFANMVDVIHTARQHRIRRLNPRDVENMRSGQLPPGRPPVFPGWLNPDTPVRRANEAAAIR